MAVYATCGKQRCLQERKQLRKELERGRKTVISYIGEYFRLFCERINSNFCHLIKIINENLVGLSHGSKGCQGREGQGCIILVCWICPLAVLLVIVLPLCYPSTTNSCRICWYYQQYMWLRFPANRCSINSLGYDCFSVTRDYTGA